MTAGPSSETAPQGTFDRAFPGFEHEVHGIEHNDARNLYVRALVE